MSTATDTALDRLRSNGAPARISQGTAIEQSRAIAQVQAMVIVAQQCPRNITTAIETMQEACRQYELAEKAFYHFPRAGEAVEGPSVHLARELARCWGNIEHGVTELRRDDLAAESEMQAFAWDLQTNTRSASIFIVPHKRDTKKGVRELTDMRDIYENNANNGARRLREAIFSVLPVWYREQAITLCQKTLEDGGGKPLALRITEAVKAFERHRVSPARLAAKFGHASAQELTATDLAQLAIIYDSLRQGTVTVDDEFPAEPDRITAADIKGEQPAQRRNGAPKNAASGDAPPPKPSPEAASNPDAPVTAAEVTRIIGHWHRIGWGNSPEDQQDMLRQTARIARTELKDYKGLTIAKAEHVCRELARFGEGDAQGLMDYLNDGVVPDGQ